MWIEQTFDPAACRRRVDGESPGTPGHPELPLFCDVRHIPSPRRTLSAPNVAPPSLLVHGRTFVIARLGSPRVLARRTALGTLAASVAVVGLPAFAPAAPPTTPFISEIHYDNAGTDTGEFVEVTFPTGTSATGWSVELYNGSNGARYDTDALAPNAEGVAVVTYDGTLQNGSPDGIALVGPGGVVEFLSYEGVMTATGSTAAGQLSTDIGVSEAGTEPVGQSLVPHLRRDGGCPGLERTGRGDSRAVNGGDTAPPPEPDRPRAS